MTGIDLNTIVCEVSTEEATIFGVPDVTEHNISGEAKTVICDHEKYSGETVVDPSAKEEKILYTAGMILDKDIKVRKVSKYTIGNTVYIR